MAIQIIDKANCCGCTACANVCGHKALTMIADNKGFKYPVVNYDNCVECGLCEKVCQFKSDYERYDNYENPFYYALRCNDTNELRKSQSGGAFYLFSEVILRLGGIVYGAGYDSCFRVEHVRAETQEARDCMRGSKYVQSDLNGIFKQIKTELRENKVVLFSGTPCQVAGLRSFIGKRFAENLFTIDLICHGVSSPIFWEEYLKIIEKRAGKKLTKVKMRDKSYGWLSSEETYEARTKTVHKNTFYSLYYNELISRPSCFQCPYTNERRVSDLTIGDYQGWNKRHTEYNDNTGISLVLVNSDKGANLFKQVVDRDNVFSILSDANDCIQPALVSPAKASAQYDAFWDDFKTKGALYVCKKYGDMSCTTQTKIYIAKKILTLKKYLHI